ncbi:MAG: ABC transporter permease [Paraclostridium sp.]
MSLFQIIKMAFKEIKSSKLRSFLTILGTAIGTASIILFVTISMGTMEKMNQEIELVSSDLIKVDIYGLENTKKKLNLDDIEKLLKIKDVEDVSPTISSNSKISYENKKLDKSINGIDENYKSLNEIKIKEGRFISNVDSQSLNKVVVLGSNITKELFKNESPIGKYINIEQVPYKVVGVMERIETDYDAMEDDSVYVPILNMKSISSNSEISKLFIKSKSIESIENTTSDIESFLKHTVGKNNFYIMSNQSIADMSKSMNVVMNTMVGAVSGVSLFVAGIGIMNMMLVSVTERTKEIGIRKSLGAKRKTILTQFLIESLVISLIGGLTGAILGIGLSSLILKLMIGRTFIAWNVVIVSLIFTIIMGSMFGIMPANKASKLKPIDALRS